MRALRLGISGAYLAVALVCTPRGCQPDPDPGPGKCITMKPGTDLPCPPGTCYNVDTGVCGW